MYLTSERVFRKILFEREICSSNNNEPDGHCVFECDYSTEGRTWLEPKRSYAFDPNSFTQRALNREE